MRARIIRAQQPLFTRYGSVQRRTGCAGRSKRGPRCWQACFPWNHPKCNPQFFWGGVAGRLLEGRRGVLWVCSLPTLPGSSWSQIILKNPKNISISSFLEAGNFHSWILIYFTTPRGVIWKHRWRCLWEAPFFSECDVGNAVGIMARPSGTSPNSSLFWKSIQTGSFAQSIVRVGT